jgi:predicted phage replisome organizer
MADTKKYYWLKLKEDFFRDKRIKKLRRIAGGDTYTVIYLKMQLLSIKNNGYLIYEGIEDNFAEELALELDEDTDNVKVTLAFLNGNGMLEETEQDHFLMTETIKCIGSESASAERVRKHRERKSQKALQCNAQVTIGNTEIEKEKEIDLDTEIETEIEQETEREKPKGKAKRFTKPTLAEVQAYCTERGNKVDAEHFYDYYEANGWKVGKNAMKDWKASVRTWERNGYDKPKAKTQQSSGILDDYRRLQEQIDNGGLFGGNIN